MKLLIDTQCWLWLNALPSRLSATTLKRLEYRDTMRFLSAASVWEIAIKYAVGKLPLPERPAEYVPRRLDVTRTSALPITDRHAAHVAELPMHHRDPFDRLIIVQAQLERLPILTADPQFGAYDVELIEP